MKLSVDTQRCPLGSDLHVTTTADALELLTRPEGRQITMISVNADLANIQDIAAWAMHHATHTAGFVVPEWSCHTGFTGAGNFHRTMLAALRAQ